MKPTAGEPQEIVQLATFVVGGHAYALDIMRVKEIINPLPITPVPRAPAFIDGVVELRGVILAVVDLRKRFDLPATPPTRATKYIVVSLEGRMVALIVDRVSDFARVARAEIKAPPPMVENEAARYFAGVCHHGGKILMVLAIDRILSSQEKLSLAGMGSA